MHLLSNLLEIKEQRRKAVQEGGSPVDKVTHTSGKRKAGGGGWLDEATEEPMQETPPFREEVGVQTRPSGGLTCPPTTGQRQVLTGLAGEKGQETGADTLWGVVL